MFGAWLPSWKLPHWIKWSYSISKVTVVSEVCCCNQMFTLLLRHYLQTSVFIIGEHLQYCVQCHGQHIEHIKKQCIAGNVPSCYYKFIWWSLLNYEKYCKCDCGNPFLRQFCSSLICYMNTLPLEEKNKQKNLPFIQYGSFQDNSHALSIV